MDRYFENLPQITYANAQVVDITARAVLLERVSNNPLVFYPYDLSVFERPDQLAYRYYDDPYKSWMIYISNKIVDPYYEWYMSDNEFTDFLITKYGNVESCYDKIVYYRNNWAESDVKLSPAAYKALTANLIEYWEPVYTSGNTISSYARKKTDWTINTNKIVKYTVSNSQFTNNEIVNVQFSPTNKGTGQICYTNASTIFVYHTTGVTVSNSTVTITANSYIYGRESKVNTAFSNSVAVVSNLAPEEEVYWKAVSIYDYETERNEYNKSVRLIDNRLSQQVVNELKNLMDQ